MKKSGFRLIDTAIVYMNEKTVGNQLTCIFVDHGFMRRNERDEVEEAFTD